MDDTVILSGTASNGIAEGVSHFLKLPLIKIESKLLPDGESYIRIPKDLSGKKIILVQSTYPPQDKHLIELFLLLDAAKSFNPKNLILVIPYLAYARQNQRFNEGEPISVEAILKLIRSMGVNSLITVEPHRLESLEAFEGNSLIIDPIAAFAKAIGKEFKNSVILAPDHGAIKRAEKLASLLKTDHTSLNKERDKKSGEVTLAEGNEYDFKGRDVVIIDDIVSTGGTVVKAAEFAKKNNAGKISVIAAHLIMADGCYQRLKDAGVSSIIGSNTVENTRARIIDLSEVIAEGVSSVLKTSD